jgi:hypothetical protein
MNEELIRSFISQAIVEGVVDNGVEDFIQATEDSIHRATYFKENGDPIAILDYMLQNSN